MRDWISHILDRPLFGFVAGGGGLAVTLTDLEQTLRVCTAAVMLAIALMTLSKMRGKK